MNFYIENDREKRISFRFNEKKREKKRKKDEALKKLMRK